MEEQRNNLRYDLIKKGGTAAILSLAGVLMVLAIEALVPQPSIGKELGYRRPSPEKLMERLSNKLQLRPDQRKAVGPIIAKELQERRKVRRQFGDEAAKTHQQMRKALGRIDRDAAKELGKILTPVQMEEFGRLQEKLRSRLAERRRNRNCNKGCRYRKYRENRPGLPMAGPPVDQPQIN